jgi:signal transduction histidine kinase
MRLGRASTDESREWSLENIDRETTRLAQLVENVLLFSRLGHGTALAPAEAADVAAEVRAIVSSFEPLTAGRAHFDLRLDPVMVPVRRECFRQVVLNLLDNAVKYGPAGQTVTVSVERTTGGARVTVADQGPGVTPAERAAIWEPFRRGSSAAAQSVGGGGIGLSIVRDVVEQHGGSVRIEDGPRGGASFVIELPDATVGAGSRGHAPARGGARVSGGAIAATN